MDKSRVNCINHFLKLPPTGSGKLLFLRMWKEDFFALKDEGKRINVRVTLICCPHVFTARGGGYWHPSELVHWDLSSWQFITACFPQLSLILAHVADRLGVLIYRWRWDIRESQKDTLITLVQLPVKKL